MNQSLVGVAGELRDEVKGMREELENSNAVVHRLKWLTYSLILVIVLLVGFFGYYQNRHNDVIIQNSRTLYVGCKNSNEMREANRAINRYWLALWVQGSELTPIQRSWIGQFEDYIDDIYAQRDCRDLTKRYELPDPPPLR